MIRKPEEPSLIRSAISLRRLVRWSLLKSTIEENPTSLADSVQFEPWIPVSLGHSWTHLVAIFGKMVLCRTVGQNNSEPGRKYLATCLFVRSFAHSLTSQLVGMPLIRCLKATWFCLILHWTVTGRISLPYLAGACWCLLVLCLIPFSTLKVWS